MTDRYLDELIRHAPGALDAANHQSRYLGEPIRVTFSVGKGGNGRIYGTVTVDSSVAVRKVRLHDLLTGLLVDETWSAADGSYEFTYLDATRKYYVVGREHITSDESTVMDRITPA